MHGIDTIKFPKHLYIPGTIKYKHVKKNLLGEHEKAKVTTPIPHVKRTLAPWSNGELEQSEARKLGNQCYYNMVSSLI